MNVLILSEVWKVSGVIEQGVPAEGSHLQVDLATAQSGYEVPVVLDRGGLLAIGYVNVFRRASSEVGPGSPEVDQNSLEVEGWVALPGAMEALKEKPLFWGWGAIVPHIPAGEVVLKNFKIKDAILHNNPDGREVVWGQNAASIGDDATAIIDRVASYIRRAR